MFPDLFFFFLKGADIRFRFVELAMARESCDSQSSFKKISRSLCLEPSDREAEQVTAASQA